MKEDIVEIQRNMLEFKDNVNKMPTMLQQIATDKDIDTILDHHREETSFSRSYQIPSIFNS